MTESGQLDVVDVLTDHLNAALGGVAAFEDAVNPQIDANPDDKLLMEMLDVVSDARESLEELGDLLRTMQQRDLTETT